MPVAFGLYYIRGISGKSNWVLYRPAPLTHPCSSSTAYIKRCVVFFPGDITDFFVPPKTQSKLHGSTAQRQSRIDDPTGIDDEEQHSVSTHYPYSLEGLAWLLSSRFPYDDLVVIRPRLIFSNFACYLNFWPCDGQGTPRSMKEVSDMCPSMAEEGNPCLNASDLPFRDYLKSKEASWMIEEASTSPSARGEETAVTPTAAFPRMSDNSQGNVSAANTPTCPAAPQTLSPMQNRSMSSPYYSQAQENLSLKSLLSVNKFYPRAATHLYCILTKLYHLIENDAKTGEGLDGTGCGLGIPTARPMSATTTDGLEAADSTQVFSEMFYLPSLIVLAGFSKGAAVLTALMRDAYALHTLFGNRIEAFHFLDPGLTEPNRLFELPKNSPFLRSKVNLKRQKFAKIESPRPLNSRNGSPVIATSEPSGFICEDRVAASTEEKDESPPEAASESSDIYKIETDSEDAASEKDAPCSTIKYNGCIYLHGTPRQLCDHYRPHIQMEVTTFYTRLKEAGINVKKILYYANCPHSLNMHFEILKDFLISDSGSTSELMVLPDLKRFFFDEWEVPSNLKVLDSSEENAL